MLANGELIAQDTTRAFFTGNSFYTTPTNRMTRGMIDDMLQPEEVINYMKALD
jgi:energy-coupling factor transport system ATP-binding protein